MVYSGAFVQFVVLDRLARLLGFFVGRLLLAEIDAAHCRLVCSTHPFYFLNSYRVYGLLIFSLKRAVERINERFNTMFQPLSPYL